MFSRLSQGTYKSFNPTEAIITRRSIRAFIEKPVEQLGAMITEQLAGLFEVK